jgi:hypothetical protein
MEIKPPGPGRAGFRPADKPADAEKLRRFSGTGPKAPSGEPPPESLEALRGASKADLQNPQRTEAIVNRCLDELLSKAGEQFGGTVSQQDRQYLAGWLARDPILRGKLQGYLEQVLK